jgi:hypothetical protein
LSSRWKSSLNALDTYFIKSASDIHLIFYAENYARSLFSLTQSRIVDYNFLIEKFRVRVRF